MKTFDTIRARRSTKKFSDAPILREEVEAILELAVLAPNHRMTEPWGFVVLGPEARRRFGAIRGDRRAGKIEDPTAAEAVRRKSIAEAVGIPLMIAFTQRLDPNEEVREEDFASVYMAIQNVLLAATAEGIGTHVKTGAILNAAETRAALGVQESERVVALVDFGRLDEERERAPRKARAPAHERTRWID
jgi:nitroreductase